MSELDQEILKRIAATCPGFQARATARTITRYYNNYFKPLGITSEQFSLLVGIGAMERTTLVKLAASSGVDSTTLSRSVRSLEDDGLVYSEGGRGRSGKQLLLTNLGKNTLAKALPIWKSAKAELSQTVGSEKLRSITEAMLELAKASSSPVVPLE